MDGLFGDLEDDIFSGTKDRNKSRPKIEYSPKIDVPLDFLKEGTLKGKKGDENESKRQLVEINYLYFTKRYEECVAKATLILNQKEQSQKPLLVEVYENLARSYFHLEDYENCIRFIRKLYNKPLPHASYFDLEAKCQMNLKRVKEALIALQQGLVLLPHDHRSWFHLSQILFSYPQYEESMEIAVFCCTKSKKMAIEMLQRDSLYKNSYELFLSNLHSFVESHSALFEKYSTLEDEVKERWIQYLEKQGGNKKVDESCIWDSKFINLLFSKEKQEIEVEEERDPSTM